MANHQAWDEVVPLENIVPLPLVGTYHDYMTTATSWYTGPTRYAGFVHDVTSNKIISWSTNVSSSYYSGDSAEAIAERPTVNGSLPPLSNFSALYFYGAVANSSTFDTYGGASHGIYMYNGSDELAQPGSLSSGGDFYILHDNCS